MKTTSRRGFLAAVALAACAGCDAPEPTRSQGPRIASASPAATDVLLRLDGRDRLVAVSRYDSAPAVAGLPRCGDALTLDWETLASARPTHLVVGVDLERLPGRDRRRAADLGIEIVAGRVGRLDDVRRLVGQLGALARADDAAARYADDLAMAATPAAEGRLLVLLDADLAFAAGRGNYVDDLITRCGGTNALGEAFATWPTLNAEALAGLEPDATLVLLPAAPDHVLAATTQRWRTSRSPLLHPIDRVRFATEPYVMTPGWTGTVELARHIRAALRAS